MNMKRILHAVLTAAGAAAIAACATPAFNVTWKNPEARPLSFTKGDKVLAMVETGNEGTRRMAEDALARSISERGLQGVPSYTVFATELTQDKDKAKAAIGKAGAAGAVVMRVLTKDQVTSTQLSKSFTYTAYWDGTSGWSTPYNPSDMRSDTVLVVETLVFDLRQDQLLWAGQSQAANPSKIEGLVTSLADAAARQLREQGLVP